MDFLGINICSRLYQFQPAARNALCAAGVVMAQNETDFRFAICPSLISRMMSMRANRNVTSASAVAVRQWQAS
jgi:hypothetical protein